MNSDDDVQDAYIKITLFYLIYLLFWLQVLTFFHVVENLRYV